MEIDLTKLTPDVRRLYDMKAAIFDKEWLKTAPDMDLYYMYRKVKVENELNNSITVILAKMLGQEFNKTMGHFHIGNYGETYTVLGGEAIFLMQKTKDNVVEDVFAIKAKRGETAIIPAGYGHVTINLSDIDLKVTDWSSVNCKSDYTLFEKFGGACYFYTINGWVKNPNYSNIPPLRFEKALDSLPKDLTFLKG